MLNRVKPRLLAATLKVCSTSSTSIVSNKLIEHVSRKLAIERSDWTHQFSVTLHKYVLLGRPDPFIFSGGAYKRVGDARLSSCTDQPGGAANNS